MVWGLVLGSRVYQVVFQRGDIVMLKLNEGQAQTVDVVAVEAMHASIPRLETERCLHSQRRMRHATDC